MHLFRLPALLMAARLTSRLRLLQMGILACDTNETGGQAFTRLDLAKHTVRALATMLGDDDKLFLIKYSDSAELILPPTQMTQAGKEQAFATISSISACGSTNIWHCLQLLNSVSSKPEFADSNVVTALLTDGLPNIRPPSQNEAASFEALVRHGNLSTFGFGYELDSKLLSAISAVGGGCFGFIPDYSMVGTVFINWAATALATASKTKSFVVEFDDGSTAKYNTGLVQYGQQRNITVQVSKKPVSVSFASSDPVSVTNGLLSDFVKARYEYIHSMAYCVGHDGSSPLYHGLYDKWSSSNDAKVKELIRDIKPMGNDDDGQVIMAQRYWVKWGKHYTRAYKRAVELEQCMNFKDPGLQILGGALFHELQKMGDYVFCNLPPLQPTGQAPVPTYTNVVPPINMGSVFMNQTGGCWAPGSMVLMANGTHLPIERVRKGMKVWTTAGPSTVDYSLELGTKNNSQGMCRYNNLWITPWHPVLRSGRWVFPSSYSSIVERMIPVVHNLILDLGHVIKVNEVLTVTLGHGFTEDTIQHDFFGSRKSILNVMENMPGFDTGHVVFDDLQTKKNPITHVITGWRNGP